MLPSYPVEPMLVLQFADGRGVFVSKDVADVLTRHSDGPECSIYEPALEWYGGANWGKASADEFNGKLIVNLVGTGPEFTWKVWHLSLARVVEGTGHSLADAVHQAEKARERF